MRAAPMDDPDEIPWRLIAASLQGQLSAEDDAQLNDWLSLSQDNRQKYEECQRLWQDRFAKYPFYRQADPAAGWESLQQQIHRKRPRLTPIAVMAVLAILAGTGWWYFFGRSPMTTYATTAGEQRTIPLPDGSSVSLGPATTFSITNTYDKTDRTVTLARGEAFFIVRHQSSLPFIVNVGPARITDIGTTFTIHRTDDSIQVTVQTGRLAFIKNSTGEEHELSPGVALSFHTRDNSFGPITQAGQTQMSAVQDSSFQDMPLEDVIHAMERIYGKKIRLEDPNMAQRKLTIRIGSGSFDDAMKIICASLDLEYGETNGVYTMRNKHHRSSAQSSK